MADEITKTKDTETENKPELMQAEPGSDESKPAAPEQPSPEPIKTEPALPEIDEINQPEAAEPTSAEIKINEPVAPEPPKPAPNESEPVKEPANQPAAESSSPPSPAPLPQEPQPAPSQAKQPIVCPPQPKIDLQKLFKTKLLDGLKLANQKRQEIKQKNLDAIMSYALGKQAVTNNDVERITGVKDRMALKYLKILAKQGKLIRFGNKRKTFYKPIKK